MDAAATDLPRQLIQEPRPDDRPRLLHVFPAVADSHPSLSRPVTSEWSARRALGSYILLVLVPFFTGVCFLMTPLQHPTSSDGDTGVSLISYALVYQGIYGLGAAAFTLMIYESSLPADYGLNIDYGPNGGIHQRPNWRSILATIATPMASVLIIWLSFLCTWAIDPSFIKNPLTHTLDPIVSLPIIVRYYYRAREIFEFELWNDLRARKHTFELVNSSSSRHITRSEGAVQPSSPDSASSSPSPDVAVSPTSEALMWQQQRYLASDANHAGPMPQFRGSMAHQQLLRAILLHVSLLGFYFFCQWCSATFKQWSDARIQFLLYALFVGVMILLQAVNQNLAQAMDARPLVLQEGESPGTASTQPRRPRMFILVGGAIAWYWFVFYRTLFSCIEDATLFAAMMILHFVLEIVLYLCPLTQTYERLRQRWAAHADQRASAGHDLAIVRGMWIVAKFFSRQPHSRVEQMEQLCVGYILRTTAFFSSLITLFFCSCYWNWGSYHTSVLYEPFTKDSADSSQFTPALLFSGISGLVELLCFAIVSSTSSHYFDFPFRACWVKFTRNKRAMIFLLFCGIHVTNDLYMAHFKAENIRV